MILVAHAPWAGGSLECSREGGSVFNAERAA